MEVGYNLVTIKAIEEGKIRLIEKRPISIIEFLRRVRRKILPKEATILGFEYLFYYCKEEDRKQLAIQIRKLLREIAELILQNGNVFQFVVEGDFSLNKDLVLKYGEMKLHLNWIFGNRIEPKNTLFKWLYVVPTF